MCKQIITALLDEAKAKEQQLREKRHRAQAARAERRQTAAAEQQARTRLRRSGPGPAESVGSLPELPIPTPWDVRASIRVAGVTYHLTVGSKRPALEDPLPHRRVQRMRIVEGDRVLANIVVPEAPAAPEQIPRVPGRSPPRRRRRMNAEQRRNSDQEQIESCRWRGKQSYQAGRPDGRKRLGRAWSRFLTNVFCRLVVKPRH